jgi:hypothetical protein
MTRHQRRKAAKARSLEKAMRLAKAELAMRTQATVERNLSNPRRPTRSGKGMGNRGLYQGNWAATARGRGVSYT